MLIPLRNYSHYSICESNIKIDDLIHHAVENKIPAISLTDYRLLSGALEFSMKALKKGIQPIIGLDVDYVDNLNRTSRLTFLCKNLEGYSNLCKLSTEFNTNPEFKLNISNINNYANGLILICGGLYSIFDNLDFDNKYFDVLKFELIELKKLFQDDLFFEYDNKLDNTYLAKLSNELKISCFASSFTFYKNQKDFEGIEILNCLKNGKYKQNSIFNIDNNYFLRVHNHDGSNDHFVANSVKIQNKINFFLEAEDPILPDYSDEDDFDEVKELIKLARSGLDLRLSKKFIGLSIEEFNRIAQIYRDRNEYELNVINNMKYSGYFLIVSDFIQWAKSNDIPVGPGRGSGAGSIVAWALMITDIDPIQFGLLFERFLNPDRVSLPDFDIDFCKSRREEVVNYVKEKYGNENVAQIITFGSMISRGILRDVGRIEGIPYGEVDRMVNKIPYNPTQPLTISELKENHSDQLGDLLDSPLLSKAESMEGALRNVGTHAAGVIISTKSLYGNIPLFKDEGSNFMSTQFRDKDCEKAGLIKFDFLGLANLTIIDDTIKYIKKTQSIDIDLENINFSDDKSFVLLGTGKTRGVFQVESPGMIDTLIKLKPSNLEEVIAVIALYRPGPMELIDSFIKRKKGEEEIIYDHPLLEPILKETFGIIVYQEQIMKIAQVIAGYSLGEADLLRRAIGKKIKSELMSLKESFIKGASKKAINVKDSEKLFSLIEKFANYGFNKSHAAAYAVITFYTAYLKAHFPLEFYCQLLNNSSNDTDKIFSIMNEISLMKIEILPPDINTSYYKFIIKDNKIMYSLSAVKGVGIESMKELVLERNANGLFKSIADFNKRLPQSVLNKKQIEKLILSNAFNSLYPNKNVLMGNLEEILKKMDTNSLFEDDVSDEQFLNKNISTELDDIKSEFESYGFLFSTRKQTDLLSKINNSNFAELTSAKIEFKNSFYFYVIKVQYKTTRNGKRFILLTVINESGKFDLRLFDDDVDASSFQANFVKISIKSSNKDDFYNQNITDISVFSESVLLSKITNFTYNDMLDLNLEVKDSDYTIKGNNGLIKISLH
ncbi:DNA polymerase III subunit alpha [Alphaproteobacteria bacterium]|nr:DNA polymerase III subunit alpha [Alphaproteobacteria bacterium]